MPEITVRVESKRPEDMTPERLLQLRQSGLSIEELRTLCNGISATRVYRLLQVARARRGKLND